jgi:hypothetical protein
MNAQTTLENARLHSAAIRIEPTFAAVTQRADTGAHEADGNVDMRWIPLLVPLLGAVTTCTAYLVVWSVRVTH